MKPPFWAYMNIIRLYNIITIIIIDYIIYNYNYYIMLYNYNYN